jgi:peptidoglycan/LPS O-acetylase OafA/YrhL
LTAGGQNPFSASRDAPTYRPDIDGLRAVAVAAVLVFHAFPSVLPGGFTGVDVFFVISGFLISTLIWEGLDRETFTLGRFYGRRVLRLFPALLVVLPVCLVLGWWLFLPAEFKTLGKDVAAAAVFGSNIVLWHGIGYFDASLGERPLTHLWSLGIEEQYYLIYPLLLMVAFRSRRLTGSLMVATLIASFAVNVATVRGHPAAAFYLLPARFWELLLGGLLAFALRGRTVRLPRAVHEAAWVVAVALLAVAFLGPTSTSLFPGWWALAPTLGAVLLIGAGPDAFLNRHVLALAPVVVLGRISYPLYLWHFPLLVFARAEWGTLSVAGSLAVLAVSVALAYGTYRLIELPVRRRARRGSARQIPVLAPTLALVGCAGLILFVQGGFASRFPPELSQLTSYTFDYRTAYRMGRCFLEPDQGPSAFRPNCVDGGKGRLVFLWGDSHAAALYPGLTMIAKQRKLRIAYFSASSCPPILSYDSSAWPNCHAVNAAVLQNAKRLRPDTVVLSAAWQLPVDDLRQTIAALQSYGIRRIVVAGPTPVWEKPVPVVLYEQFRSEHLKTLPMRTSSQLGNLSDVDDALRQLAAQAKVPYVDALRVLCNARGCLVRLGDRLDQLMFWDSSHFTTAGSRYYVGKIASQLLGPG